MRELDELNKADLVYYAGTTGDEVGIYVDFIASKVNELVEVVNELVKAVEDIEDKMKRNN